VPEEAEVVVDVDLMDGLGLGLYIVLVVTPAGG